MDAPTGSLVGNRYALQWLRTPQAGEITARENPRGKHYSTRRPLTASSSLFPPLLFSKVHGSGIESRGRKTARAVESCHTRQEVGSLRITLLAFNTDRVHKLFAHANRQEHGSTEF